MTRQTMPDPVFLFEAAMQETRKIVTEVQADQLARPTPCTRWNVQALLTHMNVAPGNFTTFLAGRSFDAGAVAQPAPAGKSALAEYDEATASLLKGAKAPGAMTKRGPSPVGEITGAQFLYFAFMDNLVHGWDLAKATGQKYILDPKLAEVAYAILLPAAEGGRKAGAFGPEVKVQPNASIQEKLLGLSGRKP